MLSLLWGFLGCHVLLEHDQLFLNSLQGVWEIPTVQGFDFVVDPLKKVRGQLFIVVLHLLYVTHHTHNL